MPASYGLIGHPLGHSLSPFIHRRLFALSGRREDYTLIDIDPRDLHDAIPALFSHIGGCNVTIPHKQAILPLLSRLEGKATLYQTVNCVSVKNGETVGYNTDADGFLRALNYAGVPLQGRVLLVGAGGAGTVLGYEAALAGCETVIYNPRHRERAERLQCHLQAVSKAPCTVADGEPDGHFDLLIHTTPVGMYPHTDACAVSDAVIARCAAVFDAVYNPRRTKLLTVADAFGAKTVGGMAMLVWQAALSHTLWYGAAFDNADIANLIEDCYIELTAHF